MNKFMARALCVLCLFAFTAYCAGDTILFDFDSGTPTPHVYQPLPLNTTVNGLTANFSGRFSVQSNDTTGFMLPAPFLNNYLSPSDVYSPTLDIKFSQMLTSITMNLATVDMCAFEHGSPVQLSAYVGSESGTFVGSATTFAPEGCGFAQSTIVFTSATAFDFVHVALVPGWASDFLADNVQVTTAAQTPVPEPASVLLLGVGVCALLRSRKK